MVYIMYSTLKGYTNEDAGDLYLVLSLYRLQLRGCRWSTSCILPMQAIVTLVPVVYNMYFTLTGYSDEGAGSLHHVIFLYRLQ